MSKKQSSRFEKHIYVEQRSGAFRFKVVIHPLQDSATFSTMEEGRNGLVVAGLNFWKAGQRIVDGSITGMVYDPQTAKLVEVKA